jgi:hypothetical protein
MKSLSLKLSVQRNEEIGMKINVYFSLKVLVSEMGMSSS